MDDNESFEALEVENTRPNEEEEEEEESESDEKHDEEEEKEQKQATVVQSSESMLGELQSEAEFRESNLETLDVPCSYVSLAKDQYTGVQVSSTAKSVVGVQLEQISSPEQEVMAAEEVRVGLAQTQSQLQDSVCPNLLSELSPTSVTQSFSSAPSPTVAEQRLSPSKVNIVCTPKQDQQNPSSLKTLYAVSIPKTSSDGYNWRKYGQKQVKSPTGSRSYYRCTYSECCAKKIECCDHSGHVIDIVYKSQHSHDPPRKVSSTRGSSKVTSSGEPAFENSVLEQPIRIPNSDASPSSKVPMQETPSIPERKQQNLYDPHKNGKIKVEEEHTDKPDPKRRVKKSELTYPASDVKPGKKAKFVVHAAGDVGISGDGYRWRKYGQKMVKGNPHPRNYYRCTSAGCPVRKHIETAVDNSSAVIITYKGVHDHDMPVPKKRHGPPSAPLVAATAPTSMNNLQLKNDAVQNQIPSTKWSVDTEGELTGEALDLGGEKAMESARTLLSIGFEIKPC
ncbi:WRKY transcription factor [Quillaja saponaria]|uniref:WRKY transcription factor n=1 Tax=Quillaja saponaria TaxID=32244 RepID=A0AAD7LCK3_QUISA|nr:WRKY transcription factor [Quillaja saponaria]